MLCDKTFIIHKTYTIAPYRCLPFRDGDFIPHEAFHTVSLDTCLLPVSEQAEQPVFRTTCY